MHTVAADSLAITQPEDIFDLSFMSYISLDTVPLHGGGGIIIPCPPISPPPISAGIAA
jgi:hypothetical protein